ncbi:unnamed protein product, partial [Brassica napus]
MLPPGPSYDHTCEQLRGTNSQRTTVLKPWTKQEQIFIQESESPFNPLIPFQSASRDEELQSQILKAFSKGGVNVESKARMSIPLSEFIQYRVRKRP